MKQLFSRKQIFLVCGLGVLIAVISFVFSASEIGLQQSTNNPALRETVDEVQGTGFSTSDEISQPVDQNEINSDKVVQELVSNDSLYPVTRVIDGDTIEVLIAGEKKTVRYIGINTPETVHPSKPVECFGMEASNKNKELVAGKSVRLVKDISETDKYGRLLRYVYVDDVFVNHALVRGGYASASSYPPDVAFNEEFRKAEQEARADGRGLWGNLCKTGGVTSVLPTSTPTPTTAPVPETVAVPVTLNDVSRQCAIKGNINSKDEKIYHVVGCGSYDKTVINEEAGERYFCTEQEALEAGWRKALDC